MQREAIRITPLKRMSSNHYIVRYDRDFEPRVEELILRLSLSELQDMLNFQRDYCKAMDKKFVIDFTQVVDEYQLLAERG